MSTTCGSLAFVGAKALRNSAIVQRLLDAGLIILAKANMTVSKLKMLRFCMLLTPKCSGIRGYEDDLYDAWLVCSWWPNTVAVRAKD
jgi:hypothetical protein